jgi:hypothetical protein
MLPASPCGGVIIVRDDCIGISSVATPTITTATAAARKNLATSDELSLGAERRVAC